MDELLLSKIRLGIVAELLTAQWVTFSEMQHALDVSQGILARTWHGSLTRSTLAKKRCS